MFLSSISINRPIMVSMFLIAFVVFGALAYFGLTLNLMPDVEIPVVTIQTVYAGAGPSEIEVLVTKKIEDAVSTVSKIDFIRSYSMEGVSYVIVQFDLDKDVDIGNQEVKDKVNAIRNEFPRDAELPVISKVDISAFPILDIVLTGEMSVRDLYDLADKKIKDRFSQIEGVGRVDLKGGVEREIRIELDNRMVVQNAISLQNLSQILSVYNMDVPGGNFQQRSQEYAVRFKGEFNDLQTIKDLDIPTAFGVKKLGDLAEVRDTAAEVRERSTYFNNIDKVREDHVVLISIIKSPDGNTVDMAREIRNAIPVIIKELPAGTNMSVVRDGSVFIESSVEDTLSNIILGVILTGLVLLFFLHDFRSTLIVATAMPFSIISTFLFLQLSDFSLNIMTLMGLSTAVGILVTNSVVVLENIFRYKGMGQTRKNAADKGTSEIAVAVIASTMTNIVVFLPIAGMASMVGQFFKEFALTVTYATIFSIIASFTVTPMLASLILPERDTKKHRLGEKLERFFHSWETGYRNILNYILINRFRCGLVVAVSVLMFILTMIFVAPRVGFEFFPFLDEGDLNIEVELPQGYNLNETSALLDKITSRLEQYDEVGHILVTVGSLSQLDIGTNLALVQIKLVPSDQRSFSSNEMATKFIVDLSDIPNAQIRVAAMSSVRAGGTAPILFYILGQDNAQLEVYKNDIVNRIKNIEGMINLNTSSRPGKPEITLDPDREKLASLGLTVFDVAMTLRASLEGLIATEYRESGNEYDIRVSLTDESVDTPEKIRNIGVVAKSGTYRMSQLADINFTEGYNRILHKDKYKSIELSAYVAPGYALGDIVNQINAEIDKTDLAPGYMISWGGSAKMMQETIIDMLRTFLIALLLTYMLLAAILENLTQPLLILGTVPLALIGVFSALLMSGKTMNTVSMMAIVMLLGIVVNNAILLLDYANILIKKGYNVHDALLEAGPTKLKPILMATVAIILGMLPMALGIGAAGREFRQPMGIVSIGGLVVSTILALIVIPALYNLTTKSKPADEVKG
jgi:HAE1 family hydrophobic/amphiphilic exporter-1